MKPIPSEKNGKSGNAESTDWSIEKIVSLFRKTADVKVGQFDLGDSEKPEPVYLVYCQGMTKEGDINEYVLPQLKQLIPESNAGKELDKKLAVTRVDQPDDLLVRIFSGEVAMYFEKANVVFVYDLSDPPQRLPQESNIEISVKGARDAFVEELQTNVALVRKRLRTSTFCYEAFKIGRRGQTSVGLLYMEDIIRPELLDEVRRRLQRIDIDILLSSSQLEEMLADEPFSLFPLLDYSSRPDYVVDCLIRGRCAILVEGSQTAVIAPTNLTHLIKSAEDTYLPFHIGSFKIFFRFLGLFVSMLIPGFWIAGASYNIEQVPYTLLSTIALSRIGLPFPGPLEAFLMVGMFELFREAGERLPKAVGQTVAVVGGIVVGDAAIRAGLASTTLIVVAAVTAVASFTLVNQSLVGSVSLIRLFVMACSSFLGMYGFMLSVIAIMLYMSRLHSFGVPFLAPLSPVTWKDVVGALFRKPWVKKKKRPDMLNTIDSTRQKTKKGKKEGES